MDKFLINGGNKISGCVKVDSAKNAILPILSAMIATGSVCYLDNFPNYSDTETMLKIIESLGGSFKRLQNGIVVDTSNINCGVFPGEYFKEIRASVFMLGATLSRVGRIEACLPGGCKIGQRPIDIHIDGLKKMGARFEFFDDRFVCECKQLKGAVIDLPFPSVGATENLLIASSVAEGETIINNAAIEPEVFDLAKFLSLCGAKIYGIGKRTIRVIGVKKLHGTSYKPIPDRIEAGTFLIASVLLGGELEIIGCDIQNIFGIINKIENSACKIYTFSDKIYISACERPKALASISAKPYPGFPTDLQPQLVSMLSVADGLSRVRDCVFNERFGYVSELNKLGASICLKDDGVIVNGVNALHGASVVAEDLRGGAGLLLACLRAEGESVLNGVKHIDRGYDKIENKLSSLGLNIKRI